MNYTLSNRTRFIHKATLFTFTVVVGLFGLIILVFQFSEPLAYVLLWSYFCLLMLAMFSFIVAFWENVSDQKIILWWLPAIYVLFLFTMLGLGHLSSSAAGLALISALALFGLSAIFEGLFWLINRLRLSKVRVAQTAASPLATDMASAPTDELPNKQITQVENSTVEAASTPTPVKLQETSGHHIELPLKPETVKKWRAAYRIVVQTRKKYQDRYNNLDTNSPKPKPEDYIEALKAKGIVYSQRQLAKIIEAGDAGLLK